MPEEQIPTTDSAAAVVTHAPATSTDALPDDFICDFCHVRMELVDIDHAPDGQTYSVRQCSADPGHIKRVPMV